MTIENTLERIADSLERLVDLQAGRNLLLEAGTATAEVAEAAVEKAATRGRGRPRKNAEEPKAEAPAAPAEEVKAEAPKVEEPASQPEPAKEAPKAEATAPAESAPAANVPSVEALQLRAPKLAQKFGKEAVTGLIKKINPAAGNISSMDDAQRVAFWAALDGLEAGATSDAEFN